MAPQDGLLANEAFECLILMFNTLVGVSCAPARPDCLCFVDKPPVCLPYVYVHYPRMCREIIEEESVLGGRLEALMLGRPTALLPGGDRITKSSLDPVVGNPSVAFRSAATPGKQRKKKVLAEVVVGDGAGGTRGMSVTRVRVKTDQELEEEEEERKRVLAEEEANIKAAKDLEAAQEYEREKEKAKEDQRIRKEEEEKRVEEQKNERNKKRREQYAEKQKKKKEEAAAAACRGRSARPPCN